MAYEVHDIEDHKTLIFTLSGLKSKNVSELSKDLTLHFPGGSQFNWLSEGPIKGN